MRVALSFASDLLWSVALPAVVLALALIAGVGALHSRGYRLSLYTVAPCAPAVQPAAHAMSVNPFSEVRDGE